MSVNANMAVPADMMAMAGDTFVAEAIRRLDLTQISHREQHTMAQAIYRGVNKSRIWEALLARNEGRPIKPPAILSTALVRPDDEIAVEEVLLDHSVEDDVVFIEYAYFRLVGRDPQFNERAHFQAALAAGEVDRREVVVQIINQAQAEGRSPVVATMNAGQAFSVVSSSRVERLLLVKRLNAHEYLIAEGGLHNAELDSDGLRLLGGLAISGPKRSLRPGRWRLKLDWGQDPNAVVLIEVTANGGAEKMLQAQMAGSILCQLEFRVLPEHLISEILIHGLERGDNEEWIVRPREVSIAWVGE